MNAIEIAKGEVGKLHTWWGKLIFVLFWMSFAIAMLFWASVAVFNPSGVSIRANVAWAILAMVGLTLLLLRLHSLDST